MASPLAISLSQSTELSKSVETLIGSYFDAASCGITGYRDSMEDAHTMMSFALNTSNNSNNSPTDESVSGESSLNRAASSSSLVSSINKNYSCFCIFDGHGSSDCSKYMAKHLPKALQTTMESFAKKKMQPSSSTSSSSPPLLFEKPALRSELEKEITKTFHQIDRQFLEVELAGICGDFCETFGSTAIVVIVEPIPSSQSTFTAFAQTNSNTNSSSEQHNTSSTTVARAMICNLGDSRALVLRDGKCVFTTIDQKPSDPAEAARINGAGEEFYVEKINNISRISGTIAVARAFGDKPFKPFINPAKDPVSSTPKIDFVDLQESDVLLLGCDGLFEGPMYDQNTMIGHLSSRMQQAVLRLQHKINRHAKRNSVSGSGSPSQNLLSATGMFNSTAILGATTNITGLPFVTLSTICSELCTRACNGGSKDNISSMLIRLSKDHLLATSSHSHHGGRRRSSASNQASPMANKQRRRSTTTIGLAPTITGLHQQTSTTMGGRLSADNSSVGTENNNSKPKRKRASSVMADHPDQRLAQMAAAAAASHEAKKKDSDSSSSKLGDNNNNNKTENNNNNNNILHPTRPTSGKPGHKAHVRSLSSQHHGLGGTANNNNSSNLFLNTSKIFSGTLSGTMTTTDPILLVNKLQSKFIAGPLPEYDRSWHIFKSMAEAHDADPKAAAKKRLRMLRVANEVMTTDTNLNNNNNNNNATPMNSRHATASPDCLSSSPPSSANNNKNNNNISISIPTSDKSNSNEKFGTPAHLQQTSINFNNNNPGSRSSSASLNKSSQDMMIQVTSGDGGPPSLQAQFSKTMAPQSDDFSSTANHHNNRTDVNFSGIFSSNDWLQQYAAVLIQSGEYTEEDIALLTCEQTSLQLAGEYHRMLAILIQQHQINASANSNNNNNTNNNSSSNNNSLVSSSSEGPVVDSAALLASTSDDQWIDYYLQYVLDTSQMSQRRAHLGSLAQKEFDNSFGSGSAGGAGTNPFKAFISMNPGASVGSGGAAAGTKESPRTDLSWSYTNTNNAQDAVLQLISQQQDDEDDEEFDEEFNDDLDDDDDDALMKGGFGLGGHGAHHGDDDDDLLEDDDDDLDDDDSDGGLNSTVRALRKR